jgi:hypothetical protein
MFRRSLFRSLTVAFGAVILASCSEPALTGPMAAPDGAAFHKGGLVNSLIDGVKDAAGLEVRAVWWKNHYKQTVRVTQTIGPAGGTIFIPQTGLTVYFPAGALESPLAITISADEKYVAYKMEPSGTRFLKDVTVTQQLNLTQLSGSPLRTQLYAAYIADDNIKLSGKVPVLEIEPSTTIFSLLSPLLPQAQVWTIRHFSRYMLASG